MKKAALYARVSSDLQKKERTIESQIAALKTQIRGMPRCAQSIAFQRSAATKRSLRSPFAATMHNL
jgi:hypothetical protein